MFQDVVLGSLFRQFHRDVDDRLLDEAAKTAGCESGIGRMSLVSDDVIGRIVEDLELRDNSSLLDVGCGRGFLERWLKRSGCAVNAAGIDRVPEAVAAARTHAPDYVFIEGDYRTHRFEEPFDAVVSLELAISGDIGDALIEAIRRSLRDGGRFALTAASIDGKHRETLMSVEQRLATHFPEFEIRDATETAADFAKRLYGAWLTIKGWAPTIEPRMHAQAHEVLASIESGDFRYTIASGRA